MGRIILDFTGCLVVCAILFAILIYFFPHLGSPGGAISTVISSMIAGQLYGRRTGAEVSSGFAWRVAVILALVSLIIGAAGLMMLRMTGDPSLGDISIGTMAAILAFLTLLSLLAIRFTFRMGVKQGIKTLGG